MEYKNILTTYLELIASGVSKEEAAKKAREIHAKPEPCTIKIKEPITVKNNIINNHEKGYDSFWNVVVFCSVLFFALLTIIIPIKKSKDALTLYEEYISMGMSEDQAKIYARKKSIHLNSVKNFKSRNK